jgi:hypothetical protein
VADREWADGPGKGTTQPATEFPWASRWSTGEFSFEVEQPAAAATAARSSR